MVKFVLIVDDNALIRHGLCELFSREADFEICGEAENGSEAIAEAQDLHPDLILLDLLDASNERPGRGPCSETGDA